MATITYTLRPAYVGVGFTGSKRVDEDRVLDIDAELAAGGGLIVVDATDFALVHALDEYPALMRSGSSSGPPPVPSFVDGPARIRGKGSHTIDLGDAEAGDVLSIDADGDISPVAAPVATDLAHIDWTRTVELIGDQHYGARQVANDKLALAAAELQRRDSVLDHPALRLGIGDITERAGAEVVAGVDGSDTGANAWLAAALIDATLIGNHDVLNNARTVAAAAAAYATFMSGPGITVDTAGLRWTIDLDFVRIICVAPDDDTVPHVLSDATIAYIVAQAAGTAKDCYVACHYPLFNTVRSVRGDDEQQFNTAWAMGDMSLARDQKVRAALYGARNIKAWFSGHTHSAADSSDLIKLHEVGSYTPADVAALPNLLGSGGAYTPEQILAASNRLSAAIASTESGTTGWTNADRTATANTFLSSTEWAEDGTKSLKIKFTATADTQTGVIRTALQPLSGLPAGTTVGIRAVLNVLQKPAKGQRLICTFYDASSVATAPTFAGTFATVLGRNVLTLTATIPAGSTQFIVGAGHTSAGSTFMLNGEVSEFYIDAARFTAPGFTPPPDPTGTQFEAGAQTLWSETHAVGATNNTLNDFSVSSAWAYSGGYSLHFKATAGSPVSPQNYIYTPIFDVIEGRRMAFVVPYNIVTNTTNGIRPTIHWLDASGNPLLYGTVGVGAGQGSPYTYLDWAEGTGEGVWSSLVWVPWGAVKARIWIGNYSLNNRHFLLGEVMEFYIDQVFFGYVDPDRAPPSSSRRITHVNAGAIPYQGRSGLNAYDVDDGELTTLLVEHAYDALNVYAYNLRDRQLRPVQKRLVTRQPIEA